MPSKGPILSQLFFCAIMQTDMETHWLWLCSKFKPKLNQSKISEVTERTLPIFITLHSSKINFIWSSVIPESRIHQCFSIHHRLLTILCSCTGQWVPSASVTHLLFIFLYQLTSTNTCWEWFQCSLQERSILPPFSPAAAAPNLKDAQHPWEGPGLLWQLWQRSWCVQPFSGMSWTKPGVVCVKAGFIFLLVFIFCSTPYNLLVMTSQEAKCPCFPGRIGSILFQLLYKHWLTNPCNTPQDKKMRQRDYMTCPKPQKE